MRTLLTLLVLLLATTPAGAETTLVSPNVYRITAGVDFSVGTVGSSDFVFGWSDGSGTFSGVTDPTLLLRVGQTYTFSRTTSLHPLAITDDSLPVSGTDGSYLRTVTNSTVIGQATLDPVADFTADPSPSSDVITWTPGIGDVGVYYYTCTIGAHTDMTGRIQVESGSVNLSEETWSAIKSLFEN